MADELSGDKVGPQASGDGGGRWQDKVMAAGGAPTTPAGCDSRTIRGEDVEEYAEPKTPGVGYKSPAFNSPARGK